LRERRASARELVEAAIARHEPSPPVSQVVSSVNCFALCIPR
jgi:hypothetical protein